ncbi:GTPase/DUF3482 domain-containing protein [Marinospirillum sp.]|uniref:GTPase/DUF3482 domain-containing protein n=1 Tax=Marinospirillum sp. TaxID=2183934 RepID=UPI00287082A3|nr:GTPase/DUF3482 domain-containing protein [Marinospirillum sp.]MDR9468706.1 GTPase/DUF3482 domain-containing protein [Marinospirillum sp.]
MNNYPHFCVVGHPNQGKSSIVSTLVENDSVQIGTESGTTQSNERFEFRINEQLLLALTDTPGFQRSRQVLAWLQQEEVSPAQRPDRVRAFLAEPGHTERFPDEVQLLEPIMAGAGILYITDAASEPTAADEAEMEILRWTGQPRMAVINPINPDSTHQQWQTTLNQFFQWVRTFNPMTATLPARQALLRAMAELTSEWTRPLTQLSQQLAERDQQRLEEVSRELANYWCEQVNRREPLSRLPPLLSDSPENYLQQRLDKAEAQLFHQLAKDWGHGHTQLALNSTWDLDSDNLMNTENWYLWGLKQKDLLLVSGAAGVAAGSLIDLGVGGSSFMLGAISGGLIGSTSGWWASKQLPGKRLGWIPLAGKKGYVGPVRHPNFPLVVMARALTFTQRLWLRPHAQRTHLTLQAQASDWPRQQQVKLLQWAKSLQQNKWKARHQQQLSEWISEQLRERLKAALHAEQKSSWRN